MNEKREKLEQLIRDVVVLNSDLADIDKKLAKIKSEAIKLYEEINGELNEKD